MDYPFVKGMVLAERLYHEGVKPVMERHFAEVRYSAGRLGRGSDTLGYDTPRSMDHGWGPEVDVFLRAEDHTQFAEEIREQMGHALPRQVAGVPTNYDSTSEEEGVPAHLDHGPVEHRVRCISIETFVVSYRPFNPNRELTVLDWLILPQQTLRLIRAGRVFHDGLGELAPMREKLHYYPDDVWYYLLSAQWERFGQECSFMGRCGEVGDELGSCILAARMIHYVMDLCFLMERQYAPYSKWFGTAFAELRCAAELTPVLHAALDAQTWQERERHLSAAYEYLAHMHNALGITEPVPTEVEPFYSRPFLVPGKCNPAEMIYENITEEEVKRLPRFVGSVDQLTNVVCVRDWPNRRAGLVELYKAGK
ncbi:MAG: DUF4037 domain-containing protein [Armatimonadota bacterium]|jgi:hypothetical protein